MYLCWVWYWFFEEWDLVFVFVMLMFVFFYDYCVFGKWFLIVDGDEWFYFEQVFWLGFIGVVLLLLIVIFMGFDEVGLFIGLQIIGFEYGDFDCFEVVEVFEDEGCWFVLLEGYDD